MTDLVNTGNSDPTCLCRHRRWQHYEFKTRIVKPYACLLPRLGLKRVPGGCRECPCSFFHTEELRREPPAGPLDEMMDRLLGGNR